MIYYLKIHLRTSYHIIEAKRKSITLLNGVLKCPLSIIKRASGSVTNKLESGPLTWRNVQDLIESGTLHKKKTPWLRQKHQRHAPVTSCTSPSHAEDVVHVSGNRWRPLLQGGNFKRSTNHPLPHPPATPPSFPRQLLQGFAPQLFLHKSHKEMINWLSHISLPLSTLSLSLIHFMSFSSLSGRLPFCYGGVFIHPFSTANASLFSPLTGGEKTEICKKWWLAK